MLATLGHDCWRMILDYLTGDFETMSRLLFTSKDMFYMTMPVMYGQLFDSELKWSFDEWSILRKRQLTYLLLQSSGFLDLYLATDLGVNDDAVNSTVMEPKVNKNVYDSRFTQADFDLWVPIYPQRLYTDYHRYLKRIPIWIIDNLVGIKNLSHPRLSALKTQFASYHVKILEIIDFQFLREIDYYLTRIQELVGLKKICLIYGTWPTADSKPDSAIEKTKMFLINYERQHLRKLQAVVICNHVTVQLCQYVDVEVLRVERSWLNVISKKAFKTIKELKIRLNPGDDSQVIPELELCSRLKCLSMSRSPSSIEDSGLAFFDWALKIWEVRNGGQHQKQKQQQQSSTTSERPNIDLPPIKQLWLSHIPAKSAMVAMKAFQDTLEEFEYVRTEDTLLSWRDWSMRRLTVLNLKRCTFDFECLNLCPALEELWLANVRCLQSPESIDPISSSASSSSVRQRTLWVPPVTLKVLRISNSECYEDLDPSGLEHLQDLRDLVLLPDPSLSIDSPLSEKINQLGQPLWRLEKLERIWINQRVYKEWKDRKILAIAPNLKRLEMANNDSSFLTLLKDVSPSSLLPMPSVLLPAPPPTSPPLPPPPSIEPFFTTTVLASSLEVIDFRLFSPTFTPILEFLVGLSKFPDKIFPSLRVLFIAAKNGTQTFELGKVVTEIMKRPKMRHLCIRLPSDQKGFWLEWLDRVEPFRIGRQDLVFSRLFMGAQTTRPAEEQALVFGLPYCIFATCYSEPDQYFYRRKNLPLVE